MPVNSISEAQLTTVKLHYRLAPMHSCFGICKGVSSALLIYFSLGRSLSLAESFREVPKGLQGK